jgi:drug/metabolite transporter (DMT)-like permease
MVCLPDRLAGALLVAAAACCWSSGGILIRLIDADGWTIIFWRSLFMAAAVGAGMAVVYRGQALTRLRAVGWPGLLSAVLLTGAFVFYVLAVTHTKVANALIIMSIQPLIAAVLARVLLGERLSLATIAAITVALAGIVVMFADGIAGDGLIGDVLALGIALCFGVNIIVLRRWRSVDMVPATAVAGVVSALAVVPLAEPFSTGATDLGRLALLGFFQLGLGLVLFVRGSRHLKAAELGLISLLEVVLAPIWVWLAIGEAPSPLGLLGGSIVLAAVIGHAILQVASLRRAPG